METVISGREVQQAGGIAARTAAALIISEEAAAWRIWRRKRQWRSSIHHGGDAEAVDERRFSLEMAVL